MRTISRRRQSTAAVIESRIHRDGQVSIERIRVGRRLLSIGDKVLIDVIVELQQIYKIGELVDLYREGDENRAIVRVRLTDIEINQVEYRYYRVKQKHLKPLYNVPH